MECGGKRSATPLFVFGQPAGGVKSGVAAALCRGRFTLA